MSYTKIKAPDHAMVVEKKVEPGDLAWPGRPLLLIQQPQLLQIEARIPESLRQKIKLAQQLNVEVDAIQYQQTGIVSEIIPSADPMSRTFLIKVKIPFQNGLYTGMFGKVLLPLEEQESILIPKQALQRVGQFTAVYVDINHQWMRRFVMLGKTLGDQVEVLSGIGPGDHIAIFKEN